MKTRPHFYILVERIAQPVASVLHWARWIEQHHVVHVGDDSAGGVRVSTVFLGMDSAFTGPPILFETMIFGGPHDGQQWRYSTWAQAHEGHQRALYLVRETVH